MNERTKITISHRARQAIVYLRQSSAAQVENTLPRQHHLPLILGNRYDHVEHQPTVWCAGVHRGIKDADACALRLQAFLDLHQIGKGTGKTGELRANQHIAFAAEV